MARIIVLGAGYAGLAAFLELQDGIPKGHDLTLVNADPYHWFVTEFHTYVAGEDADEIRIPLEKLVKPHANLRLTKVTSIDPKANRVHLEDGSLDYDYLVVGLGSDPEFFGTPGVQEHAIIVGQWKGAKQLRDKVHEMAARCPEHPHVLIIGGGLTGVEVATELADEYPGCLRLTIIEAAPNIMPGFSEELVAEARRVMAQKGIEVLTGDPVTKAEADHVLLKSGKEIPYEILVWSAGVRGSRVLEQSGFEATPRGRVKVDEYLRTLQYPNVYIVGDSASFLNPETNKELPPTGQAAVQMGEAAGKNLLRRLKGEPEKPFVPKIRGAFASLGKAEGVGYMGERGFTGMSAMMVKGLIEAKHAFKAKAAPGQFLKRALRIPAHLLRGGGTEAHACSTTGKQVQ
jgi:NADH dehydrogenase